MTAAVIYITASDKIEALHIGRTLVTERLVACANLLEGITSIYWWDDKVNEEPETVLIAKTQQSLVDAVIDRVKELHTYDCPCVVSWPIQSANPEYLDWIARETQI